jgi:hypothetical protein
MAVNDVLAFAPPSLTNQGLALGRVLVVATGANIIQFNGGGFGSEGFPFTATLTDAQIASPLAFVTELTLAPDKPGTLGTLTLAPGVVVTGIVLVATFVEIGAGVKNPWSGAVEEALIWRELAYVEICQQCKVAGVSVPDVSLGGERLLLDLGSAPDNDGSPGIDDFVQSGFWVRTAPGIALAPVG